MAILIAWNENGDILATLDGLFEGTQAVDLEQREAAGVRLRSFWDVAGAVASGTWPENIGAEAAQYRVERGADGRVAALIHRETGERRER